MYSPVNTDNRIRKAIQNLHKFYRKGLGVFMTEADIQCSLYHFLWDSFGKRPLRTKVTNREESKNYDSCNEIRTTPIHAEIQSRRRRKGQIVDLCIVDPKNVKFRISKRTFNPKNSEYRTHNCSWSDWETIGIEIKYRTHIKSIDGKEYSNLQKSLIRDLKKLCIYRRGWLVFVDQLGIYKNKKEFKDKMTEAIRKAYKGRLKTTLNVYYLSFGNAKAWSWRSKWQTLDS